MTSSTKKGVLFTDGGARGNPGPAGIGFALTVDNEHTIEHSAYIGTATNNQAEYQALREGMKRARSESVTELACYLDSELVVKQMKGIYRVKHPDLKPVFAEIQQLASHFEKVSYHHVPRAKNKLADKLVNIAIDKAMIR